MTLSVIKNSAQNLLDTSVNYTKNALTNAQAGYIIGCSASVFLGTKDISNHQIGLTFAAFNSILCMTYYGVKNARSFTLSKISGVPAKDFKDSILTKLFSIFVASQASKLALDYLNPQWVNNLYSIQHGPLILTVLAASSLYEIANNEIDTDEIDNDEIDNDEIAIKKPQPQNPTFVPVS